MSKAEVEAKVAAAAAGAEAAVGATEVEVEVDAKAAAAATAATATGAVGAAADADALDKGERTLLWHAAEKGAMDGVATQLAKGARVNKVDEDGSTPLYTAAVVELLIAAKADVDQANNVDEDGSKPLKAQLTAYRAAQGQGGHDAVVELLRMMMICV